MTNGNGNGPLTRPVTETVKALAGTPMLLVLALMNILFLAMFTYVLKERGAQLVDERAAMTQSLNKCIELLDENNGGKRMNNSLDGDALGQLHEKGLDHVP